MSKIVDRKPYITQFFWIQFMFSGKDKLQRPGYSERVLNLNLREISWFFDLSDGEDGSVIL
jgi:hypothetical protein